MIHLFKQQIHGMTLGTRHQLYYSEQKHVSCPDGTFILVKKVDSKYIIPYKIGSYELWE